MQWSKVKTILIVLLVIINCFLGANIFIRYNTETKFRQQNARNLAAVLKEQGVTCDAEVLEMEKETLYFYKTTLDNSEIESFGLSFFDNDFTLEQAGDNVKITSSTGSVFEYELNGMISADIIWSGSRPSSKESADTILSQVVGNFIHQDDFRTFYEKSGNNYYITVKRMISGRFIEEELVFSFTIDGKLKIAGYWIFGDIVSTGDSVEMSSNLAGAILGFISNNNKVKIITGTIPVYYIEQVTAKKIKLNPGWVIDTDVGKAVVDKRGFVVEWL